MLKVGDRIINKPRTDDKLPNGFGKGTIIMVSCLPDESVDYIHYLIKWDDPMKSSKFGPEPMIVSQSWAMKEVIELDIQEVRSNTLDEILKYEIS